MQVSDRPNNLTMPILATFLQQDNIFKKQVRAGFVPFLGHDDKIIIPGLGGNIGCGEIHITEGQPSDNYAREGGVRQT